MRQVGVLCAAALYALEHHVERVVDDHSQARTLAQGLALLPGVTIDLDTVQTNIVNFEVADARTVVQSLRERQVLVNAIGRTRIRAVTHLDVDASHVEAALDALRDVPVR